MGEKKEGCEYEDSGKRRHKQEVGASPYLGIQFICRCMALAFVEVSEYRTNLYLFYKIVYFLGGRAGHFSRKLSGGRLTN